MAHHGILFQAAWSSFWYTSYLFKPLPQLPKDIIMQSQEGTPSERDERSKTDKSLLTERNKTDESLDKAQQRTETRTDRSVDSDRKAADDAREKIRSEVDAQRELERKRPTPSMTTERVTA